MCINNIFVYTYGIYIVIYYMLLSIYKYAYIGK